MEYCNGGTLTAKLQSPTWSVKELKRLFCEISLGYEAIYQAKVLHEDIKPDNVLIHNGTYKIADFGFSSILRAGEVPSTKRRGTLKYMAPEKLINKEYVGDASSDVYSLGLLMFEAATGQHPYFEKENITATELCSLSIPVKHTLLLEANCLSCHGLAETILLMIRRRVEQRITWPLVYKFACGLGARELTRMSPSIQEKEQC